MKSILIVEDNETTRMVLENILEHNNFKIAGTAVNGSEGFEKYKELKPDLVILDIMMPGTDGIECLKLIKEFDSDAKVVLCTAVDPSSLMNIYAELGVTDFIMKPFKAEKLIGIVNRILKWKNFFL